ncbi:bifunctional 3,4-dihydroxy-2-butanone-4-phosphate synthase/GTP cyclohydrolase II [Sulfuriroseicoccus oceanibius]|uniref:Riboflavin biosynthesis protein RibBA n=1 Tax=Sulfuriroseicoccus oceanibius TaxID=2707525 RepID=A0A6B3L8W2_9BACT|nr:bifunctional 3,4-dihydroxy-2-butanone-4-phosphate synthase/GTP cyclohydrolase II [Sulfuriroseicoccus oceanibius]QQL46319.1 bifunctional 3,4-dihydroxy-2-butanone-4-phosphate synthase/GTP cyclohydrolase II [Sulfuriroseicoccus oceanibius]
MSTDSTSSHPALASVDELLDEVRAGRMVIITDDEARENEGDLVMAAELVTPEAINFMATHGRGLICAPVTSERARALGMPPMVQNNRESQRTRFTVSVDAAKDITTGISAPDRAATIKILADPYSNENDLVQPGHVFPLDALDGGVLRRAGHTEAAVDLARMAGLQPAGVICEIMNEDGSMARLPELLKFAEKHNLKVGTIKSLIEYRSEREVLIEKDEDIKLPTDWGDFQLHLYHSKIDGGHHLALVKGEIKEDEPVLVRVHSECLTGDVFMSQRCDCGGQLHAAMQQIENEGTGVLLYMRQEGRGIGLPAKIKAYKLQEQGLDTVEANEKLGYPADLRDYGTGAQILHDLGVRKIRLMTNNPKKIVGIGGHQLEVVEQVPIVQCPNEHNAKYLQTKKDRMGHMF